MWAPFGVLGSRLAPARGQTFYYQPEPRAGEVGLNYSDSDAPPTMMRRAARPARSGELRSYRRDVTALPGRRAADRTGARSSRYDHYHSSADQGRILRAAADEPLPTPAELDPFGEDLPPGAPVEGDGGHDAYYGTGEPQGPTEPDLMGDPMLVEPSLQGSCPTCGSCGGCGFGHCFLRRWGNHVRCAASNGAYCENLDVYYGKQGFKGPVDQGLNGDFGYHLGGNWGTPLFDRWGIGYQLGGNFIASDYAGRSSPLGHHRSQFFVTTGLFHRTWGDRGFQGGAVLDYLRDDFYIKMDLTQVRAELSYYYCGHEVGFWGAFHGNTSTQWGSINGQGPQLFSFQGNDQFNAFYRHQLCNGTVLRTWAGLSGHGDGIFGSDATVYISQHWGLEAFYNYLLPRNDPSIPSDVKESWNLTLNLVWYPGRKRCDSWTNPYRPLFYPADNGWFFARQAN